MRSELTTLITGTYNKHEFLPDAAKSVMSQTDPNWRWWIVLDDAEEPTKEIAYNLAKLDDRITCFEEKPPTNDRNPYVFNREAFIRDTYFRRVGTKWLAWLSDDDLLEPCFIEALTNKLRITQGHIAFGHCEVVVWTKDGWKFKERHAPTENLGFGTRVCPFTQIDGGQFLQSKESQDTLKDWMFQGKEPSLIDGLHMRELGKFYTFHCVPLKVHTKRITKLSTYQKPETLSQI